MSYPKAWSTEGIKNFTYFNPYNQGGQNLIEFSDHIEMHTMHKYLLLCEELCAQSD